MRDLNDLVYFVHVVDHGGFAPAGRALGMQKSKLSRRINLLEERLGVRLIQRSSRSFSVTEIGQEYYRQCVAMLAGAEAAQGVIDAVRSEPQGVIKMTCPPGLLNYHFGDLIARFMVEHPRVQVHLKAFNRRVDIIAEGYDLAIRVGSSLPEQGGLMMRKLGENPQCLVSSPTLLNGMLEPVEPKDLSDLPSLAFGMSQDDHKWCLEHADGRAALVPHIPRLVSDDLSALREAALQGIGIVQLPILLVKADIEAGRLVDVLPYWRPRADTVCAIFPSRRGLLPSIRALLDFLSDDCEPYRSQSRVRQPARREAAE
ncbi:LysR substrate-binding domain-containing protein [Reyranella sp. CPCC 100927]|uniref:LysR substrate-binding domain-containing protein n=1 Tax=Reyranella sp. CPCC 100927 TaxID=2599616 RepID=UPI0011B5552F|nr:LysR substrate-binding domain-containing protein [Reyranella sp. CPCC 100927]TWT00720.1 LysR family transcriptional regulator [Reyranella sp. CPCC 100927]